MKVTTLQELYVEELRDVYSAENQILKALPKMAEAADSDELRAAFEEHLEQTNEHVARLDQIFESLGTTSKGKKCKGMEGLLEEGKELLEEDMDPDVLDCAMIAAAQRVEHYEIAVYGCLCTYAKLLGRDEDLDLLGQTLDEEKETDESLTDLAESSINLEAADNEEESEDKEEKAAKAPPKKGKSR